MSLRIPDSSNHLPCAATVARDAASTTRMLRLLRVFTAVLACSVSAFAIGQTPATGTSNEAPAATPSSLVRPALSNAQAVTAGLNVRKWKAPGSVRSSVQEDVNSIQRDLGSTLPSLLATADAAPASVPPTFAVYRNIDALYDVLLRVAQTADLAAPEGEARSLADSLQQLESARSALGQSILSTSQHHEAEIVALQSQIRLARTAPVVAHRNENVVDDGPGKSREARRRKPVHKAVHKKPEAHPATKPTAGTPAQPPASH